MADKKPLTERQALLKELIIHKHAGNIRAAMEEAGYSSNTKVEEAIRPIRDDLVEAATDYLAANAPKAVNKLVGVLDDPQALGNKNIIAAVASILDRTGIVKTERVQVESEQPGVFLLPPKDPQ